MCSVCCWFLIEQDVYITDEVLVHRYHGFAVDPACSKLVFLKMNAVIYLDQVLFNHNAMPGLWTWVSWVKRANKEAFG